MRAPKTACVREMRERIAGLFPVLPGAIPRSDLESGHHHHVHDLIIIRLVMAIDNKLAPTGCQGYKILVFDRETPPVGDVDRKRPERFCMKQFSNFVRLHVQTLLDARSRANSRKSDR
jgi:hypothetical protein